jgi:hypothetical protein
MVFLFLIVFSNLDIGIPPAVLESKADFPGRGSLSTRRLKLFLLKDDREMEPGFHRPYLARRAPEIRGVLWKS